MTRHSLTDFSFFPFYLFFFIFLKPINKADFYETERKLIFKRDDHSFQETETIHGA